MVGRLLKNGDVTNIAEKHYSYSNAAVSDFPINKTDEKGNVIKSIINGSDLLNITSTGILEVYLFNEDENKWFKV